MILQIYTIIHTLISLVAIFTGIVVAPLPAAVLGGVLAAAILFALVLDLTKLALFHRFKVA